MTPRPTASVATGAALLSGLAWGLAWPDLRGALLLVLGAMAMGRSLTGRLLPDLGRGLLAMGLWQLLALAWVPEAVGLFGVDLPLPATSLLFAAQVLPLLLPWALASALVAREVDVGWAWGLAWLASVEVLAQLQPVPTPPAGLVSGTVVALWPAAVGGTALLSAIAVGTGAGLPRAGGGVALGAWFALGGLWADQAPPPHTVRVAILQPDVGAFDGRRASTADARAERLLRLAREAAGESPDLIVAPESAWPHDPGPPGSARRRRAEAAWADLPPMILGATLPDERANALLAVASGAVVDRFDKRTLAPLTERSALGLGEDAVQPGTRPRVLDVGGLRVGPLVCIEDMHPAALREALAHDPDLLLLSANDAWTGDGAGTAWHLGAARLAAVSARRHVVRATLSGHSAHVDAAGRLPWWTPWVDGDREDDLGRYGVVTVSTNHPGPAGVQLAPWWTALAWVLLVVSPRVRWLRAGAFEPVEPVP